MRKYQNVVYVWTLTHTRTHTILCCVFLHCNHIGEYVTLGHIRLRTPTHTHIGFIVDLKVIGLVFQTEAHRLLLFFKSPMKIAQQPQHNNKSHTQCHSIPPGQIFKLIMNMSGELKINCLQCYNSAVNPAECRNSRTTGCW